MSTHTAVMALFGLEAGRILLALGIAIGRK